MRKQVRKVKRSKSNRPLGATDDEPPMSRRESTLLLAKMCEGFYEPVRRRQVAKIFHHRFGGLSSDAWLIMSSRDHICTEEEIFERSYADASGYEYWRAWLFSGATSVDELANVLAVHWARNDLHWAKTSTELEAAAKFAPSTSPLDLVRWWRENPDTSRFVSASLASYLDRLSSTCEAAKKGAPASGENDETQNRRTVVPASLDSAAIKVPQPDLQTGQNSVNQPNISTASFDAPKFDEVSMPIGASLGSPPIGTPPPKSPIRRKRGKPKVVFERVKGEMESAIANGTDVNQMREKLMEETFKASRDTCRKVRNAIIEATKADNLSSNDK
jgi:hypothetical protein